MNDKERIDYLLTKVAEDKKESFVEDLKGVATAALASHFNSRPFPDLPVNILHSVKQFWTQCADLHNHSD